MTAARTGHLRALKIFVVDDHADTLATFSLYLQSFGHTVATARTISEALVLWPRSPHDVLLCDLRLPDGDGWELIARLVPHPLYAVACSGLGSAEDRAKSQAADFRHHLLKPFQLTSLEAILREAALESDPDWQDTKSQAA